MLCTNTVLPNGNHKRCDFRVATLVAKTFLGEPPGDMDDPTIDHKDGDIKNNHYHNLRWISRSENSSIRQNKGVGEFNHEAVLSDNDVIAICLLLNAQVQSKEIATRYGVHPSTVSNIKRGVTWKHISEKHLV